MIATMSGDVRRSYGLFLGLAADEAVRPKLRDQMLFLGLIDLQDTMIGRKARNTGHKALRARAVVDLADVHRLGARARRVLYRRAGHGGRSALLLALRRRLRDDDRGVPRRRQEPEADQPGAADAGRGRGDGPAAHGGRCADGVGSDHRASARRQVAEEPGRHDPARRGRADPAHHGRRASSPTASIRSTTATSRTTGCAPRQSVPAARAVPDGQLRERRGARQQAVQLGDRAGVRRRST